MKEYICYTKQGHWTFYADNDIEAMRLALFYCWRDNEDSREWNSENTLTHTLSASVILIKTTQYKPFNYRNNEIELRNALLVHLH